MNGANTPSATAAALKSGASSQQLATTASAAVQENSLSQLIRALHDSSLPLSERKKAIQALARNGSREAFEALKQALGNSSTEIRQAIAEALGECPNPDAVATLLALVKDSNLDVAKAAVRGLAKQQQPQAATALAQLVNDQDSSADVRCEVASALGSIHEPWVLDPLSRAARESEDDDVVKAALEGIAGLDFGATEGFFREFLQLPNISCDVKVAAVEALGHIEGDPTAFLADLAGRSPDAEIRVAAAWALSATEVTGNAGAEVLSMLSNETDPDVRLRLYQALGNQQSFDVNALMADAGKESDPSARVALFDTLAKALRDNPSADLQSFFLQKAIPELKLIALNGLSADDRQAAVIALMRARTPEALAALTDLQSQLAQMQNAVPSQQVPEPPQSNSPRSHPRR